MIGTRIAESASPKNDFFDIFDPKTHFSHWRLALVLQPAQPAFSHPQLSEGVKMSKKSLFGLADPVILVPIIIIHDTNHPGAL